LVKERGGEHTHAVASLVEEVIESIFQRTTDNRLLSIRLRNGQTKVLYRGDLVSGAILASIVQRAKEKAIDRTIQSGQPAGLLAGDLLDSGSEEFREGEMLPPDDAAEEWLKLLDHHPEQVVGVSSFRRGRQTEERILNQII
jgi:proteasome-associated ATPase